MSLRAAVNDIQIVKQFAQKQRTKLGSALRKAILFGSRAKGTSRCDSDYDILLVLRNRDRRMIDGIYEDALSLLIQEGIDISLKICSEEEFSHKMKLPTPFMAEIKRTGVEL